MARGVAMATFNRAWCLIEKKAFTVIQNQRNSSVVWLKLRGRFSYKSLITITSLVPSLN